MPRQRPASPSHQANIFPLEPPDRQEKRVNELATRVARTLGVARALAENGRRVDLAGIEDGIGVLCAQTLDLPTQDGRCMLPVLREVLAQLESLCAVLQREAPFRDRAPG